MNTWSKPIIIIISMVYYILTSIISKTNIKFIWFFCDDDIITFMTLIS